LSQLVAEIRTWDTIVPPDQAEKITELKAIARLLSPATRAEVDPERLASIDRLLASVPDEPFTEAAVPASFTTGLRERDGGRARAVLVFPALNKGIWKSENLGAYVGGLRRLAAEVDPQTPARVAGALPLSLDLTTSIRRDGSLASVVAFSGVVVLVIMMFRWSRHTLLIVGSLVVGVLWLVGATFALGVKINFVNFIALPITFGIGVDYAVNVMARFIQDGGRDVVGPVRSTGAAVGLCSLTTIIGYSSLLLAQNQGLFLFGLVAVLGEIACLVTALALLPATLLLLQRRRRTGLDPAEPAPGE
jgi:hypothetical protein